MTLDVKLRGTDVGQDQIDPVDGLLESDHLPLFVRHAMGVDLATRGTFGAGTCPEAVVPKIHE